LVSIRLLTVVETSAFARRAEKVLSAELKAAAKVRRIRQ